MIGNHISAHAYACVYRVNDTQFIPTKRVMHNMHVRTHMRMHYNAVSRIMMHLLSTQYDTHPYVHTLTLLFSPANSPPRTTYAFKERSCSGRHQDRYGGVRDTVTPNGLAGQDTCTQEQNAWLSLRIQFWRQMPKEPERTNAALAYTGTYTERSTHYGVLPTYV